VFPPKAGEERWHHGPESRPFSIIFVMPRGRDFCLHGADKPVLFFDKREVEYDSEKSGCC